MRERIVVWDFICGSHFIEAIGTCFTELASRMPVWLREIT